MNYLKAMLRQTAQSQDTHANVVWYESTSRAKVRCLLKIGVSNQQAMSSLRMEFTQDAGREDDGSRTIEFIDTRRNALWSEIKLTIPIRVRGFQRPMLLVKWYRPDWLDYILYAPLDTGIVEVFAFSCRHEASVKWLARDGQLERIITFDRFAPSPRALSEKARGDEHWQLREEWVFAPDGQEWKGISRQWIKYRFDESFQNRVISRPSDCKFLFKSR
jgi:hypothetical protein